MFFKGLQSILVIHPYQATVYEGSRSVLNTSQIPFHRVSFIQKIPRENYLIRQWFELKVGSNNTDLDFPSARWNSYLDEPLASMAIGKSLRHVQVSLHELTACIR